MDITHQIAQNKGVKIDITTEDVPVFNLAVDGVGELRIVCNPEYPEIEGDPAVMDLLMKWAEGQENPLGEDPVYTVWAQLTGNE